MINDSICGGCMVNLFPAVLYGDEQLSIQVPGIGSSIFLVPGTQEGIYSVCWP